MSAGLLFQFKIPFWSEGCYDVDTQRIEDDDCADPEDIESSTGIDEDDLPNLWYLGATFSYHVAL